MRFSEKVHLCDFFLPFENQRRINVVVSESDLRRLKVAAATLDTTVNEIIRGLIVDFIGTPKDLDDIQPF